MCWGGRRAGVQLLGRCEGRGGCLLSQGPFSLSFVSGHPFPSAHSSLFNFSSAPIFGPFYFFPLSSPFGLCEPG